MMPQPCNQTQYEKSDIKSSVSVCFLCFYFYHSILSLDHSSTMPSLQYLDMNACSSADDNDNYQRQLHDLAVEASQSMWTCCWDLSVMVIVRSLVPMISYYYNNSYEYSLILVSNTHYQILDLMHSRRLDSRLLSELIRSYVTLGYS